MVDYLFPGPRPAAPPLPAVDVTCAEARAIVHLAMHPTWSTGSVVTDRLYLWCCDMLPVGHRTPVVHGLLISRQNIETAGAASNIAEQVGALCDRYGTTLDALAGYWVVRSVHQDPQDVHRVVSLSHTHDYADWRTAIAAARA